MFPRALLSLLLPVLLPVRCVRLVWDRIVSGRFRPALYMSDRACVFVAGVGVAVLFFVTAPVVAAESAVVLMYHRFGEDSYPSTNVTIEQFEDHIAGLEAGGYTVWPLADIVDALESGGTLPPRTVAITVDDGFRSVYEQAWPRLKAAGFPFTVFVATDSIDRQSPGFMSWDDMRELRAHGVTIASHGASHLSLVEAAPDDIRAEIARSTARFQKELGHVPRLFSFPYGESSPTAEDMIRQAGFTAAFGQQSGPVYAGANRFLLPRFALNETYGAPDRFRQIIETLPLPVTDVTPRSMIVTTSTPPEVGFTVDSAIGSVERLSCYFSAGTPATISVGAHPDGESLDQDLPGQDRRVRVDISGPMPPGRSRLNCTLLGPDGRWRWLSMMFYRPHQEGREEKEDAG